MVTLRHCPVFCSDLQVKVGPFTVIRSIDSLTETLADMLSAEKRDFTLSTKNISEEKLPDKSLSDLSLTLNLLLLF